MAKTNTSKQQKATIKTAYIDILVDGRFYAQYRYRYEGNIDYQAMERKLNERYPSLRYKDPSRVKIEIGAQPA